MFDWLSWSNPVALWWVFLVGVSLTNIAAWIWSRIYLLKKANHQQHNTLATRAVVWLSAAYVFGCAFRSFLPRADVQRICLFDTWFSNVLVGRSVATIAELAFIAQWGLVLWFIAPDDAKLTKRIAVLVVPIIFIAECFSWYAVTTTHYLGNTVEESLWAVTYSLLAIAIVALVPKLQGALKYAAVFAIVGCFIYVIFMVTVDVPMYFHRWQADLAAGKAYFGFFTGIADLNTRWRVTHSIEDWRDEIPWMSLYFSVAVWTSLALCYVPLRRR